MYGFNMFSLFSLLFPIVFIFVFGMIIFTFVKGIGEWSSNNKQPVISVVAKVVGKRGHTSSNNHHHDNNHVHSSSSTSYYATLEVESGDRMEFHISAKEFGMIAEGDIGKLTFQGTRYHSFERIIN